MLPLLGQPLAAADLDKDGTISIGSELTKVYQQYYSSILELLKSPCWAAWYEGMKAIPTFESMATKVTTQTFVYHALNDAQVPWSRTISDIHHFAGPTKATLFPSLGHSFSPMDGTYGEVKTTGPFATNVLKSLSADLQGAL